MVLQDTKEASELSQNPVRDKSDFLVTFHPQPGSKLLLQSDLLTSLYLQPTVVAAAVLQGGAVDPQRQVVLTGVPLQSVPLILVRPGVTGG